MNFTLSDNQWQGSSAVSSISETLDPEFAPYFAKGVLDAASHGGGFGRSSPGADLGCLERYHRVREVFFSQGYPVSNGIAVGYDRLVLSLATVQND